MSRPSSRLRSRGGFTLVELLVVIAIIAILSIMMLPAINATREAARRSQCLQRAGEVIVGVSQFEMAHGTFPMGVRDPGPGPILNAPQGLHQGWLIDLLPYLDENLVYRSIDREVSVYAAANAPARGIHIISLICPSEPTDGTVPTSAFAGVHHDIEAPIGADQHGVLYWGHAVTRDEISDGLAYTLVFGEKLSDGAADLGWMSGTRATLRNVGTRLQGTPPSPVADVALQGQDLAILRRQQHEERSPPRDPNRGEDELDPDAADEDANSAPVNETPPPAEAITAKTGQSKLSRPADRIGTPTFVGGFGSSHGGGAIFAFGDGHVAFLPDSTDEEILRHAAHRADGALYDLTDLHD